MLTRSLALAEKAGPNHQSVALALNNLAALYLYQDRYADAEPLLKRSVAVFEKALGPNHPEIADVIDNLAEMYKTQGRTADAEPLFKRSAAIRDKAGTKI
jgi:tetratricopeptide (TPR) repeat protein